jgi:hypothetical protein
VNHVVEDSPADKGGLKDGDVIVGFSGDVVRGPAKLTQKIHGTKPGDKVQIDVRRDGRVAEAFGRDGQAPRGVAHVLERRQPRAFGRGADEVAPREPEGARGPQRARRPQRARGLQGEQVQDVHPRGGGYGYWFGNQKPLLGVELVNTTKELREAMGGRKDAGVLVGKVIAGSAAEKAGVKAGDLILSVDGAAVVDPGDLGSELEEREGRPWTSRSSATSAPCTSRSRSRRSRTRTRRAAPAPALPDPRDGPDGAPGTGASGPRDRAPAPPPLRQRPRSPRALASVFV